MKKTTTFAGICFLMLLSLVLAGCGGSGVTVNVSSYPGADNLNLQAVGGLLGKAQNPEELEKLINDPNGHINNLDLDNDDQTDFIQVTEDFEQASNTYSYDLTDVAVNKRVATLTVTPNGTSQATVQAIGDPAFFGQGVAYSSHLSLGDALFLAYVFRPHPYYVPVYGLGRPAPYYAPYRVMPVQQYRTQTQQFVTTSKVPLQQTKSPEIRTQKMPDTTKYVPPPSRPSGGITSQRPMTDPGSKQTSGPIKNFGPSSAPASRPAAPASRPPSAPSRSTGGRH